MDLQLMYDTLGQAGMATATVLRVLLIVAGAGVAIVLTQRAIRAFRIRVARHLDDREAVQRAETLGRAARYMASVVISMLAAMLVLGELGVSLAPILGAAGVVGLAVGFGAQSLVKDYFSGFFLLLENQIRQGDVVKLGSHAGLVEELTLRYVRLRDYDGNVHFVPNGEVQTVINMSRGHAFAVVDVSLSYGESVEVGLQAMRDVGAQMRADTVLGPLLLEDLEIAGVEAWGDSAIQLRCRFKCAPLQQWTVRREFLRRLKETFDERGIEIPYPQLTLSLAQGVPGAGQPWPFALQGAMGEGGKAAQAGGGDDAPGKQSKRSDA